MELSRQEYPALLRSLQPADAALALNERVKLIGRVNSDIADWLQERRRVEEAYVQGLKKLAGRRQDAALELGIFQTPWQSIIGATDSVAESHNLLAQRIEVDVERPLREYQSKNREMQAMSTIQGNLVSMAKDVEGAQKRAEKLKSNKSSAGRVASASSDVETATQQWSSQAPFVFEQLQALDENRINHLRDVLTQFQTHEVDQVERNRVTAESCLNVILNVDTKDEISTFVAQTSGGSLSQPIVPIQHQNRNTTSSTLSPHPPSRGQDTMSSGEQFTSFSGLEESREAEDQPQAMKKGGIGGGLKRLGTVIGRRRGKAERPPSPDKKSRSNLNPLRRGRSSNQMQEIPSPDLSASNTDPTPKPRPESSMPSPQGSPRSPQQQRRRNDYVNGDAIEPISPQMHQSSTPNGTSSQRDIAPMQDAQSLSTAPKQIERDAEGYSVPASSNDDISRAQQDAGLSESEQNQLKLDIRSDPIQETDADAQNALSKVANTLRAQQQTTTPRRSTTGRGRRDVRNTIYIPSPQLPDQSSATEPPLPFGADSPMPLASPPIAVARGTPSMSEIHRGSDARSIQSSHSLSSLASNNAVRHPDLHKPGLGASVVETISAWFTNGQITRSIVIGELALAYNTPDSVSRPSTESIRLENFPVLEKVAPNPAFISQIPSRSGEYTVDLSQLSHTSVAFKYQVHLDETNVAAHAPVVLHPEWKVEPTQSSVIIKYAFNPAFASAVKRSVSLQNVTVAVNVESSKARSCQSKPVGTFVKEKSLIYWKLGDITLDGYADAPHKLLARFATEPEAKAGSVEARWEISGEHSMGMGSGLSLSQTGSAKEEGSDPFADESVNASPTGAWKDVPVLRKLVSGKYVATS